MPRNATKGLPDIEPEPNRHGTGTNMVVTILVCVEELAMELDLKKINGARFPVVL